MESELPIPISPVPSESSDPLEILQNLDQRADSIIALLVAQARPTPAEKPRRGCRKASPPKPQGGIQESSRQEAKEILKLFKDHKALAQFDRNKDRLGGVITTLETKTSTIRELLGIKPSTETKRHKRSTPDHTEEEGAAPASLTDELRQPPEVARQEEHAAAAVPLRQQEAQQQMDVVVPIPPTQEEPVSKRRRQIRESIEEHKGVTAYAVALSTGIVRVGTPLLANPVVLVEAGIAYAIMGELARRTLEKWPEWDQRQRNAAVYLGTAFAISATVGGMTVFGPSFPLFPIAPAIIGSAGFGGALLGGSLTTPQQRPDVEMGAPAAEHQPPAKNPDPRLQGP